MRDEFCVPWRPFAEALSGDFTVYLWDMPGYVRSSKDAGHAVDFGVQAEALRALLEHWVFRADQRSGDPGRNTFPPGPQPGRQGHRGIQLVR